jgi:isopenicillin-N N-acyltransferase-like protein
MFILRDILQYETSLEGAKNRIVEANRTCNLIIGLGDGKLGSEVSANGVEFSGKVCNFYDDETLLPVNNTWHKQVEDVVYNGMDWLCPGFNQKLQEQLQKFHGSIEETVVVRDILPTVQTGNLHIAVFDLTDSLAHVSFCRKSDMPASEPEYAYERQFTRLHMQDIFAQARP